MSSPALLLDVDLVAQLRALVRTSRFKRLVMVLLANKATGDEELDRLKTLFDEIDVDGSGAIDVGEFGVALGKLGKGHLEASEVQELFDAADVDGTGSLEYGEFVAAVAGPQRLARQASKAARDVMDALDTDGSGSISAEEVVKVMRPGATLEEAQELVSEVDVNGDGQLDYDEVFALMNGIAVASC